MTEFQRRQVSLREFWAEGLEYYGKDCKTWVFACVRCGHHQSINDYIAAGKTEAFAELRIAFSCIGREVEGVGCDWTLGGLFTIHKLEVFEPDDPNPYPRFEFVVPETRALSREEALAYADAAIEKKRGIIERASS